MIVEFNRQHVQQPFSPSTENDSVNQKAYAQVAENIISLLQSNGVEFHDILGFKNELVAFLSKQQPGGVQGKSIEPNMPSLVKFIRDNKLYFSKFPELDLENLINKDSIKGNRPNKHEKSSNDAEVALNRRKMYSQVADQIISLLKTNKFAFHDSVGFRNALITFLSLNLSDNDLDGNLELTIPKLIEFLNTQKAGFSAFPAIDLNSFLSMENITVRGFTTSIFERNIHVDSAVRNNELLETVNFNASQSIDNSFLVTFSNEDGSFDLKRFDFIGAYPTVDSIFQDSFPPIFDFERSLRKLVGSNPDMQRIMMLALDNPNIVHYPSQRLKELISQVTFHQASFDTNFQKKLNVFERINFLMQVINNVALREDNSFLSEIGKKELQTSLAGCVLDNEYIFSKLYDSYKPVKDKRSNGGTISSEEQKQYTDEIRKQINNKKADTLWQIVNRAYGFMETSIALSDIQSGIQGKAPYVQLSLGSSSVLVIYDQTTKSFRCAKESDVLQRIDANSIANGQTITVQESVKPYLHLLENQRLSSRPVIGMDHFSSTSLQELYGKSSLIDATGIGRLNNEYGLMDYLISKNSSNGSHTVAGYLKLQVRTYWKNNNAGDIFNSPGGDMLLFHALIRVAEAKGNQGNTNFEDLKRFIFMGGMYTASVEEQFQNLMEFNINYKFSEDLVTGGLFDSSFIWDIINEANEYFRNESEFTTNLANYQNPTTANIIRSLAFILENGKVKVFRRDGDFSENPTVERQVSQDRKIYDYNSLIKDAPDVYLKTVAFNQDKASSVVTIFDKSFVETIKASFHQVTDADKVAFDLLAEIGERNGLTLSKDSDYKRWIQELKAVSREELISTLQALNIKTDNLTQEELCEKLMETVLGKIRDIAGVHRWVEQYGFSPDKAVNSAHPTAELFEGLFNTVFSVLNKQDESVTLYDRLSVLQFHHLNTMIVMPDKFLHLCSLEGQDFFKSFVDFQTKMTSFGEIQKVLIEINALKETIKAKESKGESSVNDKVRLNQLQQQFDGEMKLFNETIKVYQKKVEGLKVLVSRLFYLQKGFLQTSPADCGFNGVSDESKLVEMLSSFPDLQNEEEVNKYFALLTQFYAKYSSVVNQVSDNLIKSDFPPFRNYMAVRKDRIHMPENMQGIKAVNINEILSLKLEVVPMEMGKRFEDMDLSKDFLSRFAEIFGSKEVSGGWKAPLAPLEVYAYHIIGSASDTTRKVDTDERVIDPRDIRTKLPELVAKLSNNEGLKGLYVLGEDKEQDYVRCLIAFVLGKMVNNFNQNNVPITSYAVAKTNWNELWQGLYENPGMKTDGYRLKMRIHGEDSTKLSKMYFQDGEWKTGMNLLDSEDLMAWDQNLGNQFSIYSSREYIQGMNNFGIEKLLTLEQEEGFKISVKEFPELKVILGNTDDKNEYIEFSAVVSYLFLTGYLQMDSMDGIFNGLFNVWQQEFSKGDNSKKQALIRDVQVFIKACMLNQEKAKATEILRKWKINIDMDELISENSCPIRFVTAGKFNSATEEVVNVDPWTLGYFDATMNGKKIERFLKIQAEQLGDSSIELKALSLERNGLVGGIVDWRQLKSREERDERTLLRLSEETVVLFKPKDDGVELVPIQGAFFYEDVTAESLKNYYETLPSESKVAFDTMCKAGSAIGSFLIKFTRVDEISDAVIQGYQRDVEKFTSSLNSAEKANYQGLEFMIQTKIKERASKGMSQEQISFEVKDEMIKFLQAAGSLGYEGAKEYAISYEVMKDVIDLIIAKSWIDWALNVGFTTGPTYGSSGRDHAKKEYAGIFTGAADAIAWANNKVDLRGYITPLIQSGLYSRWAPLWLDRPMDMAKRHGLLSPEFIFSVWGTSFVMSQAHIWSSSGKLVKDAAMAITYKPVRALRYSWNNRGTGSALTKTYRYARNLGSTVWNYNNPHTNPDAWRYLNQDVGWYQNARRAVGNFGDDMQYGRYGNVGTSASSFGRGLGKGVGRVWNPSPLVFDSTADALRGNYMYKGINGLYSTLADITNVTADNLTTVPHRLLGGGLWQVGSRVVNGRIVNNMIPNAWRGVQTVTEYIPEDAFDMVVKHVRAKAMEELKDLPPAQLQTVMRELSVRLRALAAVASSASTPQAIFTSANQICDEVITSTVNSLPTLTPQDSLGLQRRLTLVFQRINQGMPTELAQGFNLDLAVDMKLKTFIESDIEKMFGSWGRSLNQELRVNPFNFGLGDSTRSAIYEGMKREAIATAYESVQTQMIDLRTEILKKLTMRVGTSNIPQDDAKEILKIFDELFGSLLEADGGTTAYGRKVNELVARLKKWDVNIGDQFFKSYIRRIQEIKGNAFNVMRAQIEADVANFSGNNSSRLSLMIRRSELVRLEERIRRILPGIADADAAIAKLKTQISQLDNFGAEFLQGISNMPDGQFSLERVTTELDSFSDRVKRLKTLASTVSSTNYNARGITGDRFYQRAVYLADKYNWSLDECLTKLNQISDFDSMELFFGRRHTVVRFHDVPDMGINDLQTRLRTAAARINGGVGANIFSCQADVDRFIVEYAKAHSISLPPRTLTNPRGYSNVYDLNGLLETSPELSNIRNYLLGVTAVFTEDLPSFINRWGLTLAQSTDLERNLAKYIKNNRLVVQTVDEYMEVKTIINQLDGNNSGRFTALFSQLDDSIDPAIRRATGVEVNPRVFGARTRADIDTESLRTRTFITANKGVRFTVKHVGMGAIAVVMDNGMEFYVNFKQDGLMDAVKTLVNDPETYVELVAGTLSSILEEKVFMEAGKQMDKKIFGDFVTRLEQRMATQLNKTPLDIGLSRNMICGAIYGTMVAIYRHHDKLRDDKGWFFTEVGLEATDMTRNFFRMGLASGFSKIALSHIDDVNKTVKFLKGGTNLGVGLAFSFGMQGIEAKYGTENMLKAETAIVATLWLVNIARKAKYVKGASMAVNAAGLASGVVSAGSGTVATLAKMATVDLALSLGCWGLEELAEGKRKEYEAESSAYNYFLRKYELTELAKLAQSLGVNVTQSQIPLPETICQKGVYSKYPQHEESIKRNFDSLRKELNECFSSLKECNINSIDNKTNEVLSFQAYAMLDFFVKAYYAEGKIPEGSKLEVFKSTPVTEGGCSYTKLGFRIVDSNNKEILSDEIAINFSGDTVGLFKRMNMESIYARSSDFEVFTSGLAQLQEKGVAKIIENQGGILLLTANGTQIKAQQIFDRLFKGVTGAEEISEVIKILRDNKIVNEDGFLDFVALDSLLKFRKQAMLDTFFESIFEYPNFGVDYINEGSLVHSYLSEFYELRTGEKNASIDKIKEFLKVNGFVQPDNSISLKAIFEYSMRNEMFSQIKDKESSLLIRSLYVYSELKETQSLGLENLAASIGLKIPVSKVISAEARAINEIIAKRYPHRSRYIGLEKVFFDIGKTRYLVEINSKTLDFSVHKLGINGSIIPASPFFSTPESFSQGEQETVRKLFIARLLYEEKSFQYRIDFSKDSMANIITPGVIPGEDSLDITKLRISSRQEVDNQLLREAAISAFSQPMRGGF